MSNKKRESLKRALEAARALFMRLPYEDVTLSRIATEAKCSMATLYQAYGSKRALYEEVRLKPLENNWAIPLRGEKASLRGIVRYFVERAQTLGEESNLHLLRSASQNAEVLEQHVTRTIALESRLGDIIEEIRFCIEAKLLRDGDPQAVAYVLYAGCGFEPITYGLLFGADDGREPIDIVRTVLSVLATPAGMRELDLLLPNDHSKRRGSAITLANFLKSAQSSAMSVSAEVSPTKTSQAPSSTRQHISAAR